MGMWLAGDGVATTCAAGVSFSEGRESSFLLSYGGFSTAALSGAPGPAGQVATLMKPVRLEAEGRPGGVLGWSPSANMPPAPGRGEGTPVYRDRARLAHEEMPPGDATGGVA